MNEQEHVADLLAAYALDALEPDEQVTVETHLAECEACRVELAIYEESIGAMPLALEVAHPSEGLRAKVLAAAGIESTVERAPTLSIVPTPARSTESDAVDYLSKAPVQLEFRRRRPWLIPTMVAAAAVLLFISGGLIQRAMQSSNNQTAAQKYQQLIGQAVARGDKVTRLAPQGALAGSAAVAVTSGGKASLIVGPTPPTPKGKVYQLWFLNTKADAVSADVYTANQNTANETPLKTKPGTMAASAVTVEPEPHGSPKPTTNPVMLGVLSHS